MSKSKLLPITPAPENNQCSVWICEYQSFIALITNQLQFSEMCFETCESWTFKSFKNIQKKTIIFCNTHGFIVQAFKNLAVFGQAEPTSGLGDRDLLSRNDTPVTWQSLGNPKQNLSLSSLYTVRFYMSASERWAKYEWCRTGLLRSVFGVGGIRLLKPEKMT